MTTDAVGGVWQYSVDLCHGLSAQGIEILLACMGPEPSPAQRAQLNLPLAARNFALEWMPNPWPDVDAAGHWLLELRESFKPDLIHLNGYSHAVLPWQAPVAVACHSCVFTWWDAVYGDLPGPEWDQYRRRVSAGLSRADMIFSPTHHLARQMASIYHFQTSKLRVIPNFSVTPPRIPEDKQALILAAGRAWDQAKNLELLRRISPRVNAPITICTGLPHTEVLAKMLAARVFAHPALYEPFGLAVLEAARCSCALVLADIPTLRELWDGAALFVNPHHDDAWTQELNRISANAELAAQWGTLARTRSEAFHAAASLHAYRQAYAA